MKPKCFKPQIYVKLISCMLILLWVYAATSKLISFERSKWEMMNQPLDPWFEKVLVWAVPLIELTTAVLLIYERTRLKGIILSAFLLLSFSIYITLIKLNYFGFIPCSCGGILRSLSWTQHLLFNLFFLTLSLTALIHYIKERRNMK